MTYGEGHHREQKAEAVTGHQAGLLNGPVMHALADRRGKFFAVARELLPGQQEDPAAAAFEVQPEKRYVRKLFLQRLLAHAHFNHEYAVVREKCARIMQYRQNRIQTVFT